jgi:hypothetical protein
MTTNTFTLHSDDLEGRIAAALEATRAGIPVILLDDFDRENEADLIVAAEKLTRRDHGRDDPRMQRHRLPVPVRRQGARARTAAHGAGKRQPLRHARSPSRSRRAKASPPASRRRTA